MGCEKAFGEGLKGGLASTAAPVCCPACALPWLCHFPAPTFRPRCTNLGPAALPGRAAAGVMGREDLRRLKAVSASQGLMLESTAPALLALGAAHHACPDKARMGGHAWEGTHGRARCYEHGLLGWHAAPLHVLPCSLICSGHR